MSKERKNFADPEQLDTLIGKEISAEGTLDSEGDIQVNGQFQGEIKSNGDVIVAEHAKVKADITATNVYVAGEVDGNIAATERLEILETGRVNGNVASQALSIEPGGILKGSSTMTEVAETEPDSKPAYEVEEETE